MDENKPSRLNLTDIPAERNLEDWIVHDPSLLEQGLVIVGRQIRMEGGLLDLLALDPQGRWVLIEIKRERLRREVIAQAIDYASCLYQLDPETLRLECDNFLRSVGSNLTLEELLVQRGRKLEAETDERDVTVYLVGTSLALGLERMVQYLVKREMSLRLVTISAFQDGSGRLMLAREIHENLRSEAGYVDQLQVKPLNTIDDFLARADTNGVGEAVRTLYNVAKELGLHVRPWTRSLMIAPPANRTRCLFAITIHNKGGVGFATAYISSEAFEQFYQIAQDDLTTILNMPTATDIPIDKIKADRLASGLRTLILGQPDQQP